MPSEKQDKEKPEERVLLSVWVPKEILRAIDRKVAKLQEERTERVHRSDVVRDILSEWSKTTTE